MKKFVLALFLVLVASSALAFTESGDFSGEECSGSSCLLTANSPSYPIIVTAVSGNLVNSGASDVFVSASCLDPQITTGTNSPYMVFWSVDVPHTTDSYSLAGSVVAGVLVPTSNVHNVMLYPQQFSIAGLDAVCSGGVYLSGNFDDLQGNFTITYHSASSTLTSTKTGIPFVSSIDSGNTSLGLGILIALGSLMLAGYMYNHIPSLTRARRSYDPRLI